MLGSVDNNGSDSGMPSSQRLDKPREMGVAWHAVIGHIWTQNIPCLINNWIKFSAIIIVAEW